ncbi:MAG: hypothetical protein GEU92_00750 [Alphaproteobacteria bacterium]|nr:hypothetical protein [Alphaproteobacteria bacterium]
MMRALILSAAVLLSPAIVHAAENLAPIPSSLYRSGEPAVLEASPATAPVSQGPDETAAMENFRRSYGAAKRPRIAIYWNEALTDRISQWFQTGRVARNSETEVNLRGPRMTLKDDRQDTSARGVHNVESRPRGGGGRSVTMDLSSTRGTVRSSESAGVQHLQTEPKRAGMTERISLEFENGFYGPFLAAGTRLVDRAAIVRLARNDMPNRLLRDTSPDLQVLEVEALKDYADLLLEVLLIPDSSGPTGFAFRVVVKRVLNGAIVASHFSRISDEPKNKSAEVPKGELTTGPGGFYRKPAQPEEIDPNALGRRLAFETMEAMRSMPAH